MSSILASRENAMTITIESLQKVGFNEIVWGAPTGKKGGKHFWKPSRRCWEKIFTVGELVGSMVYFPDTFDGYVRHYGNRNPINSVIMYIDGAYALEDWFEIIDVTSMIGIDLAENRLRKKIEEYENHRR